MIGRLRKGRWVMYQDRIGIIIELTERSARVMLTDEEGLNKIEVLAPLNELRQARAKEIPQKRVEQLDAAQLKAMGYL